MIQPTLLDSGCWAPAGSDGHTSSGWIAPVQFECSLRWQTMMNQHINSHEPAGGADQVRAMQIIAGALIAGVTMFALLAIMMTMDRAPEAPLISYIAAGSAALATLLRAIIPAAVARRKVDQLANSVDASDGGATESQLYRVYQTSMIIGMAMLEGTAFFCLIAYMGEANMLPLTATGVLLVLMFCSYPTQSRVDHWVENQLRLMSF